MQRSLWAVYLIWGILRIWRSSKMIVYQLVDISMNFSLDSIIVRSSLDHLIPFMIPYWLHLCAPQMIWLNQDCCLMCCIYAFLHCCIICIYVKVPYMWSFRELLLELIESLGRVGNCCGPLKHVCDMWCRYKEINLTYFVHNFIPNAWKNTH